MIEIVKIVNAVMKVPVDQRHQSLKSLFLNLRHLKKRESRKILDIHEFIAYEGDRICIIGRNGNGKTTFLKVVAGIYRLTEGVLNRKYQPTIVLAAGIGLEEELTVEENIELSLIYKKINGSRLKRFKLDILDFCELTSKKDIQFKHLSTGYKSRLAFAIATCERPDLLILDEVLGGGDEFFMKRARDKVLQIINESKAALICTHAPDDMIGICNRCLVFEDGKITFDGDLEQGIKFYRSGQQGE